MAYTNIDDPSAYFQTALWTGTNAKDKVITNDGNSDLQPDLIWAKARTSTSYTDNHFIVDSSRGRLKGLVPNDTSAETTTTGNESQQAERDLQSFDTDGFTVGIVNSTAALNASSASNVAWQWKVNGGTTTSLSSNINSVCQVNQDAGISIVKYTCTGGGNGQAVQHGLGLVPQVIITKNRTDTSYSDWITYHHILTKDNFVKLNSNAASATNSPYNGAAPTSSTYNVSIDLVEATKDYVSYVFAPIQGYSKFGSYVGNGSTNGTFVYTGFKPAFVMVKAITSGKNWDISTGAVSSNQIDERLRANLADAEESSGHIDFLSNGFKMRNTNGTQNSSGVTYIYMAFAKHPFVTSTGIPTTAR